MTLMPQLPFGHSAVMAQRASSTAPDVLDDFPTPPWATRALVEHVLAQIGSRHTLGTVWEPACNRGLMAKVLEEYTRGMPVIASDIWNYGYGKTPVDFLGDRPLYCLGVDWIITNPPFKVALEFALLALERAHTGVALLLRTQWVEGETRYHELFSKTPPTLIAPFVERVPMHEGRWDPDGDTATSYSWFVWLHGVDPIAPYWIPPGRRQALTKPDDRLRFAGPPDSVPLDVEPHLVQAVSALEG